MAAERWRLFVAIDLGAAARDTLAAAQAACRRHARELPVRWVEPRGAHLTVQFLGDVERERAGALVAALTAVAAAHRPFLLRTGPPGAFPNARRPRVLWLGLTGPLDRLNALQQGVELALRDLDFPPEPRPFRPHLTLGRVREGGQRRPDATPAAPAGLAAAFAEIGRLAPAPLPVAELRLMRSELGPGGPRYTMLGVARLGAGRGEG